jgi:hypothetical protein
VATSAQEILFVLPDRDTGVSEDSVSAAGFFLGVQVLRYRPSALGGICDFLLQCHLQSPAWLNKTVLFCPDDCHIIGFEAILSELLELKGDRQLLFKTLTCTGSIIGFRATQENLDKFSTHFSAGKYVNQLLLNPYKIIDGRNKGRAQLQEFWGLARQHFEAVEGKFSAALYYQALSGPVPDVIFDDLRSSSAMDGATTRIQEKLAAKTRRLLVSGRDVCFVAISEGPDYEQIEEQFFENCSGYCAKNGYSLFLYRNKLIKNATANWSKAALLDIVLGQFSHIVYVDIDTAIVGNKTLHDLFSHEMSSKSILFFQDPGNWDFNSGSIILRNDPLSRAFLKGWSNKCSSLALQSKQMGVYDHGGDQQWAIVTKNQLPPSRCETLSHERGWNVHPNYSGPNTTMLHFMGLGSPSERFELIKFYLEEVRSKSSNPDRTTNSKGEVI